MVSQNPHLTEPTTAPLLTSAWPGQERPAGINTAVCAVLVVQVGNIPTQDILCAQAALRRSSAFST